MNRRKFIGAVVGLGSTVVAGCSGDSGETPTETVTDTTSPTETFSPTATPTPSPTPTSPATPTATVLPDSDDDEVPDAEDDFPENPDYSVLVDQTSGTAELSEDDYYDIQIGIQEESDVIYDAIVRSGPAIDAFLMTQSEFLEYSEGNNARILDGSRENITSTQATTTLDTGTYYLALDNTNSGEAEPPANFDDDVVEVEYEMVIAR